MSNSSQDAEHDRMGVRISIAPGTKFIEMEVPVHCFGDHPGLTCRESAAQGPEVSASLPIRPATFTEIAMQAILWGRAPRQTYRDGRSSEINCRIVCADGFRVSVQASPRHYCDDSLGSSEPLYFRMADRDPEYPFTLVEVGNPSADLPVSEPWSEDGGGIWGFVDPRHVLDLLTLHGGAVEWESADS